MSTTYQLELAHIRNLEILIYAVSVYTPKHIQRYRAEKTSSPKVSVQLAPLPFIIIYVCLFHMRGIPINKSQTHQTLMFIFAFPFSLPKRRIYWRQKEIIFLKILIRMYKSKCSNAIKFFQIQVTRNRNDSSYNIPK